MEEINWNKTTNLKTDPRACCTKEFSPYNQVYRSVVVIPEVQDNHTILRQDMLPSKDTKYIIRYNMTLNGLTVTIPENCILEFDGGCITGGTLVGNDTLILNVGDVDCILDSVTKEGTWRTIEYNKDETDAMLAEKADKADTYTKEEVDALIDTQDTSCDDKLQGYYTKRQSDTKYQELEDMIEPKADKDSLSDVAFSGRYDDLLNQPVIPSLSGYAKESWVSDKIEDMLGVDASGISTLKAILEDGSTASGILAHIARKADSIDVYTKTEVDGIKDALEFSIGKKADQASTYTKPDVDLKLDAKANTSSLAQVATSGLYSDLINKPVIPSAPKQANWNQTDPTALDYIKNKPTMPDLARVATSGAYNDLIGKPIFKTINGQTITGTGDIVISEGSSDVDLSNYYTKQETYSKTEVDGLIAGVPGSSTNVQADWNQTNASAANYIKNKPAIPTVPTKVSAFTNDAGYLTASDIAGKANKSDIYTKQEVDEIVLNTDKAYDPSNNSGLGIKHLDPKEGDTHLTASDFDKSNTIYIISGDFDLGGGTITIPSGCIFRFDGGSIDNGTIVGNNTGIDASLYNIFNGTIIEGSWSIEALYSEWFGAIADGSTDCTEPLQRAINTSKNISGSVPVHLITGTYNISSSLNLHNGLTIQGIQKEGDSVIKATAGMTGMLVHNTANNSDYVRIQLYDLTLDGNGTIPSGDNLRKTKAKATDGILIGNHADLSPVLPMVYSTIRNVFFKCIDGYAISISGWGTLIDNCKFDFCENGIYGWSGNGLKITNSVFNYTTKIGVSVGGYDITIRDSVFDYSGHCAILIGSESRATIDSNYFERASMEGMWLFCPVTWMYCPKKSNDTQPLLHPVIVAGTGTGIQRFDKSPKFNGYDQIKCEYTFGLGYPSTITVTNNYLDYPEDNVANKFFVFASALTSGRITDNFCRDNNNTRTVFGMPLDPATSLVHDVEISRNWNVTGHTTPDTQAIYKQMPRFGGVTLRDNANSTYFIDNWCYNIYTNDMDDNPIFNENVMSKVQMTVNYDGESRIQPVVEIEQSYKGQRVFRCTGNQHILFKVNKISGKTLFNIEDYDGLCMELSYYFSSDGANWEKRFMNSTNGLNNLFLPFSDGGGYITLPIIRIAGGRQSEGTEDYRPAAVGNNLTIVNNPLKYLPGTEVHTIDSQALSAYITGWTGTGSDAAPQFRVVTDILKMSSSTLNTWKSQFPNGCVGMTVIETGTMKPVYFDSENWRYYDGTIVN